MSVKSTNPANNNTADAENAALQKPREIDPNVMQRRAAAPDSSVWVGASAGTGKTKVLTDRVLRLLLPRGKDQPGTPAHKILCLTFTKTAASEMSLRIHQTLARWAVLPEEALQQTLSQLLGRAAYDYEMTQARQLFAMVVDSGAGLQIMTIHSFCQSVLGRFPLEAGLIPYFNVLEEGDARALLTMARNHVINEPREADEPLSTALARLTDWLNEEQFEQIIGNIMKERGQLARLLKETFGPEGMHENLCRLLDIPASLDEDTLITQACAQINEDAAAQAARALGEHGGVNDQKRAAALVAFLQRPQDTRFAHFDDYMRVFVTANYEAYKSMATKAVQAAAPDIVAFMEDECERILIILEQKRRVVAARLTADLMSIGSAIADEYERRKSRQGTLDFDDLILKTAALLGTKSMAGWVHYKMDQGLDHILIDEAQDTNPEQWEIARALAEEFFAGLGSRDYMSENAPRTVFVVGDEKQSIYSFQRASPEAFDEMRDLFAARIQDAAQKWDEVALNISFRSTAPVLELVDKVISHARLHRKDIVQDHQSFRNGQAGHLVLWPVLTSDDDPASALWEPPITVEDTRSGAAKMAEHVAEQIKGWLDAKEVLQSHDRPIEAGDIMILVRTRNAFAQQLTRALKLRDIPLAGHDRMVLGEELVIEDLLSLGEFALLPDDDLTLASLLKSPLIGLDEDQLFALCHDRPGSLWARVQSVHPEITRYLQDWTRRAAHMRPFEFFSRALQMPCPPDDKSGLRALKTRLGDDITDPVDEFLGQALQFENTHLASLQHFIQHQRHEHHVIKREMEGAKDDHGGQVRIMTVHGAKGLQAPIVILPDTMRVTRGAANKADTRLLWPASTALPLPLFAPRKDMEPQIYRDAKDHEAARADEEYRRLLYVAMTRAEERLYVGGYAAKRTPMEDSWYFDVKKGFESLRGSAYFTEHEDGTLIYDRPRVKEPDKVAQDHKAVRERDNEAPPAWLHRDAPPEAAAPGMIVPSRLSNDDKSDGESFSEGGVPVNSPISADNQYRFLRGNITHKLLELLPEIPPDKRKKAALNFTRRYGAALPAATQSDTAEEVLRILEHPEFSAIFGAGSIAEVALSGLVDDKNVMSGQIDRLLITPRQIMIIDYKTNRAPPASPADIPAIYINQMRSYCQALQAIYPQRSISCALLWTDGPELMVIPPAIL